MLGTCLSLPTSSPSMRRAKLSAILAWGLGSWSFDASAQSDQHFALEWESPSVCPQQPEVDEQIRTLLGAAPGSALPSHLRAKGVIAPIGERFQLTVSIQMGQTKGTRVIAADECRSLGKAAAVVLGLLIRKERDLGRALSDSDLGSDFAHASPPPPSTPITSPKADEPTPQTPDEPSTRTWFLLARGPSVTLDYFTMPEPQVGFSISAGVLHHPWRAFVSGALWLSEARSTEGVAAYRATFKRQSLEAWACHGWRWGELELSPCILSAVEFLSASASGDRLTRLSPHTLALTPGGGLTGYLHLAPHLALFFAATGRFWTNRPAFEVQGMFGTTYRPHTVPLATVQTSIGSEWFF